MKIKTRKKTVDVPLSCDVIKILRSEVVDDHNRIDLRIVKWSNGKERVLERRRVWLRKDGAVRNRKMIGLSSDDISFINKNNDEIIGTLRGDNTDGN